MDQRKQIENRRVAERRKDITDHIDDTLEKRDSVVDRRLGLDRRRGPGRRLSFERKYAEEGYMTDEQFEFIMAVDQYKRENRRPFPTWTEVLELIIALGYRKVAEPQSLKSFKKEEEPVETAK